VGYKHQLGVTPLWRGETPMSVGGGWSQEVVRVAKFIRLTMSTWLAKTERRRCTTSWTELFWLNLINYGFFFNLGFGKSSIWSLLFQFHHMCPQLAFKSFNLCIRATWNLKMPPLIWVPFSNWSLVSNLFNLILNKYWTFNFFQFGPCFDQF
jgi:hypothetical protein